MLNNNNEKFIGFNSWQNSTVDCPYNKWPCGATTATVSWPITGQLAITGKVHMVATAWMHIGSKSGHILF